ncbi:MAG: HAD family phosphatase [Thermodesulfobacteriota bacterium]|nr:HAD family phosphatase [Thermodesulfobacteriota bacterium]
MIQAVLFDFGRVISAQKPASLFRAYEDDLGLEPGTINRVMFECQAWNRTLVGEISLDDYWRTVGPKLNLRSPEAIRAFRRRYREDERPNLEVIRIIGKLKGACRLAVLSNSPPGLRRWLADWRIDHHFHVIFCSGDEGIAKPDPRAYLQTLDRLAVAPERAVFVDDALENVQAARRIGLHAILFENAAELEGALSRWLSIPPAGEGGPVRTLQRTPGPGDTSEAGCGIRFRP